MFGRRADGRVLKEVDPIVALTPYLMPMRCDAQVFLNYKLDYEILARYIVDQGQKGNKITFLELVIAAFVRTVAALPEVNRFIVNKRMYARTQLTVSFVVLRDTDVEGKIEETTVKCAFDLHDTIYDVAERVQQAIDENRKAESENSTLKVARLVNRPALANTIVFLARTLDRYGIMPKYILNASPFHTSLFITHMASIGMPSVNHHIYNFGTTTMFFSIGSVERSISLGSDGKTTRKRYLPIGVTADERICAGAMYAKLVANMQRLLSKPELLESPPETVRFEENNVYSLPTPKQRRLSRKEQQRIAQ